MKRKLQEIENLAFEVLSQNEKKIASPIDVSSIAKKLGLEIHNHNLEDEISGILMIEDGIGKIGVNSSHAPVRQRFTIAHEIGHYVLKHARQGSVFIDLPNKHMKVNHFRDQNSTTGQFWQEREANAFAAALLMPKTLIDEKISKYSFELNADEGNDLIELAKEFEVSSQAMAIRLSNLGYFQF